jgi:hypothetical protein
MEPVPAAPAKKSSAPLIIALIAAALLSLCCCAPGILVLLGFGTWETSGIIGNQAGSIPPLYGLVCIGAAIIPWFIPIIVALIRRTKNP